MQYDVIIVGGSYAGLAAAMPLARARRKILVVDAGQRRNRFAGHSHGFLTQDGTQAAAIAAKGREQLLAYRTVGWLDGKVAGAQRHENGFRLDIEGMPPLEARRLVLATGVVDRLPPVPGLAERWGTHVFHCPYCHGYELNQGPIGVLATSPMSMHLALLLPDWGPTTLFLNDAFEPDAEQLEKLQARGVRLERSRIERIEGSLDLVLHDGRIANLDGLFTLTTPDVASPIAAMLGCEFDEGPMGRTIRTDAMKATTVQGVFACGDAARPGGSLPLAVGDGTIAGAAAHQSLIFGGY
ncbi:MULTISPECIES: NAD(P)/FAD-dependent oxidoreductase [Lysobacter]|uniref:NAD(P)/FAD-dependent oxidoreductase n=1 Tax=Lysobacter TaxID=68 RepID=UPI001F1980B8|nr:MULTISPECIES: NAD(P)/FAD-dependent oxidoreductase [Lysobacter]UJB20655.1 NAD(P)/FAD-dependent oxidoreductase [Lysobacter capsici]UJQ30231.1 NAD(P)/FAD-dependent oxidoreductase [Lysobacter gummosus]